MDVYLQDMKNNISTRDLMKHEWARFKSFRHFPKYSIMSPLRLAQAGFYYTDVGETVCCFSCGQTYNKWREGDTAIEVHKQISPNCPFIQGDDNLNVSIHDTQETTKKHVTYDSMNSNYRSQKINDASGGPEDINTTHNPKSLTSENKSPNANESKCDQIYKLENSETAVPDQPIDIITTKPVMTPSISYNNAKHPEYAVKKVREASYAGWRENISPIDLSESGFFYAGFQDCVRCFYCGGGLKNWDYGDSPWVEHARWYPECNYLRKAKGEEFVQKYREDGQGTRLQETEKENLNIEPLTTATTWINEGNINMQQALATDMNSVAVESLLEMGYTRNVVAKTVKVYRQKYGNRPVSAETLLEIILDSDKHPAYLSNPRNTAGVLNTTSNATSIDTGSTAVTQTSLSSLNINPPNDDAQQLKNKESLHTGSTKEARKQIEYKSLVEENRSLREQIMCKICMDNDANIVFLPCGHLVACTECAPAIRKCAVCRKLIKGTVRAFPS